jgi:outer membrane protein assembly factor BamD (BamD/ComL family)
MAPPCRGWCGWWLAVSIASLAAGGCQLFPGKTGTMPEYEQARREIESFQDSDGEWIRPEGRKAEVPDESWFSAAGAWLPSWGKTPLDRDRARSDYQAAEQLFEEAGQLQDPSARHQAFAKAGAAFLEAGKYWPSSAVEHDSLLMAAESYFFAESFVKAEDLYLRLLKEYPRSRYSDLVDSRRMSIANYWLKFEKTEPRPFYAMNLTDSRFPWSDRSGHGRRTLESIRLTSPTGRMSDQATMALANEHFGRGKFRLAADTYEDLRLSYPDSKHQFAAHFLGLRAVLETYEGPDYDIGPLDEAEKLLNQITRLFRQQAEEQKAYLDEAYKQIRLGRAERLWTAATYRANRQEYQAAVGYLDQLIADYDDTSYAAEAEELRARIEDRPADPPRYFSRLGQLFERRDQEERLIREAAREAGLR